MLRAEVQKDLRGILISDSALQSPGSWSLELEPSQAGCHASPISGSDSMLADLWGLLHVLFL